MIQGLVLVKQSFVIIQGIFIQLTILAAHFKTDLAVMYFDRLLEVVNVDKLDVKLVV